MKIYEDIKLINNLYYLGSIVTIMDYPEGEKTGEYFCNTQLIGETYSLKVNDNICINVVFGQLGPDIFSISDYEVDQLFVKIVKDCKVVGVLNFTSVFNNSEFIGINTADFSSEIKFQRIEKMKPNCFKKAQMVLRNFHSLNPEDIAAINCKATEIKNWAFENTNKNKKIVKIKGNIAS